jgi:hypothetical protein
MLKIGDSVIHPMFPDWGKGIIAEILFDSEYGIHIARVMWQSLNTDKLAFHTLNHLRPFVDSPISDEPKQLELFLR